MGRWRVSLKVLAIAAMSVAATGQMQAAIVTYQIPDIGNFADYTVSNTGQSYYGTGFVGMYSTYFAHLFGLEGSSYSKAVLEVDITALAGKTINSAFLNFLLLDPGSASSQNVTVTSFTADGSLEHFWTPPNNLGAGVYAVAEPSANSLDVTSLVDERISAGASWLGLHLQGSTAGQWTYTWTDIYNRNLDSAQVRLIVDFSEPPAPVPEPSSLAVFGLVVAGMAICAARRRKQLRNA